MKKFNNHLSVALIGEVDAGKTSLIEKLGCRVQKEERGITQKFYFYRFTDNIWLNDLPGHLDFDLDRSLGFKVASVILLVVEIQKEISENVLSWMEQGLKDNKKVLLAFTKTDLHGFESKTRLESLVEENIFYLPRDLEILRARLLNFQEPEANIPNFLAVAEITHKGLGKGIEVVPFNLKGWDPSLRLNSELDVLKSRENLKNSEIQEKFLHSDASMFLSLKSMPRDFPCILDQRLKKVERQSLLIETLDGKSDLIFCVRAKTWTQVEAVKSSVFKISDRFLNKVEAGWIDCGLGKLSPRDRDLLRIVHPFKLIFIDFDLGEGSYKTLYDIQGHVRSLFKSNLLIKLKPKATLKVVKIFNNIDLGRGRSTKILGVSILSGMEVSRQDFLDIFGGLYKVEDITMKGKNVDKISPGDNYGIRLHPGDFISPDKNQEINCYDSGLLKSYNLIDF